MSLEMGFQYQWDSSVPPTDAAHYAKRLGFESIWVGEHSHIPVQRETQFPGRGDLPVGFRTVPEPFTCLAAVSSVTNLRLGLAVLVLPMRDAIMTAKEIATLDALSAGRVMVGVGTGWLVEEMRNHGVQDYPRQAYSLLREAGRGDEADLDQRTSGVPWKARQLRPYLVRPQTNSAAAPPGADRRERATGAGQSGRLWRWVDFECTF